MRFRHLAIVAVGACATPSSPPSAAPMQIPVIAPVASAPAPAPSAAQPRKLRFEKHDDGVGGSTCSVVDEATGDVVGHATSQNTAAGGSTIECYDFVADGKIIRFWNSRGIYAKDARPGADDTRSLSCGDGVFASDVTTCVDLDTASQAYDVADATTPAAPFDIHLCSTTSIDCKSLVSIPRGMNRIAGPGAYLPRWWDAKYCTDTRVLVIAEGVARLFEAPSGKLLAKAPAPGVTRIERCEDFDIAR